MCSDSDVAIMRDWLKKQKHLPQDVEDNYLKTFIVASKGSIQVAKSKFEKFHMLRHVLEMENISWDPFSTQDGYLDKIGILRLPGKSPEGYTIFISKYFDVNGEPDDKHIIKWVSRFYFVLLCGLWDNDLGDCQMIMINDWAGITLGHVKGATPAFLRQFSDSITGGVPLRIKGSHEIGLSSILEFIINTVNTLVPKKLRQRRFAHSKIEGLYEHLPQEYLPSDYGGKGPSLLELNEETKKTFKRHLDKLISQKAQVAAEKPFVPTELKPESNDTFKKLDFD